MKKVYLESPYITTLGVFMWVMFGIFYANVSIPNLNKCEDWGVYYTEWATFILPPLIPFIAKEFFGFVIITPNKVTSIRPFRRIKTIDYEDICDIAIDYSVVSGGQRLYSLIISKCRIPGKYMHRVNCIPRKLQREMIIFSYDKKQYQTLFEYLPPRARKLLENCQSSIRLYHLDKE